MTSPAFGWQSFKAQLEESDMRTRGWNGWGRRLGVGVMWGLPALVMAQPAEPPPAGPDGVDLDAAVQAALGRPPADARVDPSTFGDPGFVERVEQPPPDQTYRSSAPQSAAGAVRIQDVQLVEAGLEPIDQAPAPEDYVVQPGDTLWDLSARYLADPYLWPKLWSWNEQVTNPHWMFPGDRIRLRAPGERSPATESTSAPWASFQRRIPARVQQPTYVLNQVAFVSEADFDSAMRVNGGAEAQVMLSTLDTVYLDYDRNQPPIPGERLIVYAPTESVKDLRGKTIGHVVSVIGEVEVNSLAAEAVEGTVVTALNPVERGYRVGPLRRVFRRIERRDAKQSAAGRVVATLESTGPVPITIKRFGREPKYYNLAGDELYVIVDIGETDGVMVGNVLEVVRKGDGYTKKRIFALPYEDGWPRRTLAALLVVDVQANTALCATIFARREFERGDRVELRGPELQDDESPVEDVPERRRARRRRRANTGT